MLAQAPQLNVHLSQSFVQSLNAAIELRIPGLLLVNGVVRDFQMTAIRGYLRRLGESLQAIKSDVVFMESARMVDNGKLEFVEETAPVVLGQVVFADELRSFEDVTRAIRCVQSGAMVVAAIHGEDGEDALQYLKDLARTNELPAVRVIAYAARHELVD